MRGLTTRSRRRALALGVLDERERFSVGLRRRLGLGTRHALAAEEVLALDGGDPQPLATVVQLLEHARPPALHRDEHDDRDGEEQEREGAGERDRPHRRARGIEPLLAAATEQASLRVGHALECAAGRAEEPRAARVAQRTPRRLEALAPADLDRRRELRHLVADQAAEVLEPGLLTREVRGQPSQRPDLVVDHGRRDVVRLEVGVLARDDEPALGALRVAQIRAQELDVRRDLAAALDVARGLAQPPELPERHPDDERQHRERYAEADDCRSRWRPQMYDRFHRSVADRP